MKKRIIILIYFDLYLMIIDTVDIHPKHRPYHLHYYLFFLPTLKINYSDNDNNNRIKFLTLTIAAECKTPALIFKVCS